MQVVAKILPKTAKSLAFPLESGTRKKTMLVRKQTYTGKNVDMPTASTQYSQFTTNDTEPVFDLHFAEERQDNLAGILPDDIGNADPMDGITHRVVLLPPVNPPPKRKPVAAIEDNSLVENNEDTTDYGTPTYIPERLFDHKGDYSEDAIKISEVVRATLGKIMKRFPQMDTRDLALVIQEASYEATHDMIMSRRV